MNWASWSDFLSMGGYGLYVWGSYAVTACLIAVEIVLLRGRRRASLGTALENAARHDGENRT